MNHLWRVTISKEDKDGARYGGTKHDMTHDELRTYLDSLYIDENVTRIIITRTDQKMV